MGGEMEGASRSSEHKETEEHRMAVIKGWAKAASRDHAEGKETEARRPRA